MSLCLSLKISKRTWIILKEIQLFNHPFLLIMSYFFKAFSENFGLTKENSDEKYFPLPDISIDTYFLSVILLYGTWASHSNLHLKGIQNLKHLPQIAAFWVHLVRGWIIHLSYFHTAQLLEKSLTLPERDIAAVSPDKAGVWFKIFAAPRRFSNTSSNGKWNTIYKIWNGINSNLYFSWKIHRL